MIIEQRQSNGGVNSFFISVRDITVCAELLLEKESSQSTSLATVEALAWLKISSLELKLRKKVREPS